jgi:hypothetical protein
MFHNLHESHITEQIKCHRKFPAICRHNLHLNEKNYDEPVEKLPDIFIINFLNIYLAPFVQNVSRTIASRCVSRRTCPCVLCAARFFFASQPCHAIKIIIKFSVHIKGKMERKAKIYKHIHTYKHNVINYE